MLISVIVKLEAARVIISVDVYEPSRITASEFPLAERRVTPGELGWV